MSSTQSFSCREKRQNKSVSIKESIFPSVIIMHGLLQYPYAKLSARQVSLPTRSLPFTRTEGTAQPSLLQWLVHKHDALPRDLKVERKYVGSSGWGLVALEDIAPDELILSVPWSVVIVISDVSFWVTTTIYRLSCEA